ncbi:hypothetical protein [Allomeiothermus silvanus]|uniref:hypothetical protein n=1 Tax=Allomeiothermus silvanus TaxID=52022 RepID=UPI0023F360E6|nr:hypothetical protein [Allomeiothermus silvanus]
MRRFAALLLSLLLSSCVYLVEDTKPDTRPIPVPNPQTVPAPSLGNYTYTCTEGRLVVSYVTNDSVRVFYNDAFQVLSLRDTSPERVYSNGTYTWSLNRSGQGTLRVGSQLVRTGCTL